MKIAWRRRADKRTFTLLILIPAHVEGQVMPNISTLRLAVSCWYLYCNEPRSVDEPIQE
jgi:hypothetical protein